MRSSFVVVTNLVVGVAYTVKHRIDEDPSIEEVKKYLFPHLQNGDVSSIEFEVEEPEVADAETGVDALFDDSTDEEETEDTVSEDKSDDVETFRTDQDSRYAEVIAIVDYFLKNYDDPATVSNVTEIAEESDWDVPKTTVSTYMSHLANDGVFDRHKKEDSNAYVYSITDAGDRALVQLENDQDIDVVVS